ncbi:MAG: insulinase family protein [Candidatus Sumerlaeia bacterium]|nr:insulinase family protein [Candidatus Sumerlaeia bacterium]
MYISKLNNGMTVLIQENHANPIVTLDVWVNTGSMNELPEINGVSHFLEHMMFKGTEKRPAGKVDLDIESVGGETNAGTSKDFTHYYVTVASEYVTTGLDVLSDVIMNSTLAPDEVERERQVILEEFKRKQDAPFNSLYDIIHDLAFKSGPYKQSVLGTQESISQLTRAQLMDYYRRYYTPDNMVLVVVGDVKAETLIPEIQKYFGRYRRTAKPYELPEKPTRWGGPARRIIEKDKRESYTVMAFPAPGMATPRETIIMDVLTGVLGNGRSSRLYQSLREKKQIVSSISANYELAKKPSLFLVFTTHEPKHFDDVCAAVLDEIRRVRTRRVGARELAKVKKMALNEYYFATETTNGHGFMLGVSYVLSGSEKYERTYLRELNRVSASDLLRVARRYLDPEKMVVATIQPKQAGKPVAGEPSAP